MKITAIIPAYNEEQTIANVVHTLVHSLCFDEVIVVSDGSTDSTADLAKRAGAIVYNRGHRMGKGEALLYALSQTDAPILAFFDADLRGLTKAHIEQLVLPVVHGSRWMNVGLRDRGWFTTRLTRYLPLIAGERVLRRNVIENIPAQFLRGYMIEAALNYYCRSYGYSYGAVELNGLSIRRKYEKVGWLRAVLQYVRMFYQVVQAMVIVRIAHLRGKF